MAIVFVSHSHFDADLAMKIKNDLDRFGISTFVAHTDIVPSSTWRDEIVKELGECKILVALLTNDYKKSPWTDQECGIAIARGRTVLPVAIELMPYGFMEQFQAFIWNKIEPVRSRRDLVSLILSKVDLTSENFVRAFEKSPSFDDAGHGIRLILDRSDLTPDHINRVANAAVENNQIYEASSARAGVIEFFRKYEDRIDERTKRRWERRIQPPG